MKLVKQVALSLLVAGSLPLSMAAQSAAIVQVDALGKVWDVSYVYGEWNDLEALLTGQPWWGECCEDGSAAEFMYEAQLAGIDHVNAISGPPWYKSEQDSSPCDDCLAASPFFAWTEIGTTRVAVALAYSDVQVDGNVQPARNEAVYWAVATPHAVPLPGTLGLLGVALAGVGLARRKFSA